MLIVCLVSIVAVILLNLFKSLFSEEIIKQAQLILATIAAIALLQASKFYLESLSSYFVFSILRKLKG
jgi:hypothetical protein